MVSGRIAAAAEVRAQRAPGRDEFRQLAERAPVMIWRSGRDRRCDYFNRRWLEFTGRTLSDEVGLGWAKGVHAEDYQRCVETFLASHAARLSFAMDYHLRRHDGAYRWVLSNGVPYYRDGEFAGFVGTCVDISDHQDEPEHDVRAARRRETALRELNHRLKNSLQTSISFSAFGRPLADRKTQDDLSSVTERLSLLALAHEQLSCLHGGAGTGFCDYLQSLAQAIHAAVGNPNVELQVTCQPVALSKKRASAIGTIVDELLTAALTQRFPERRPGTVQIGSRPLGDRRIELSLADDGVNEPVQGNPPQSSFQRQLVERLIAHANGTIRYELDGGTRCVITLEPE
jgi:PAS domain S-box-containing protein